MVNELKYSFGTLLIVTMFIGGCSSQQESSKAGGALTAVVIGDAGERSSELKRNARLLKRMHSGEHDGGKADVMIFLGDNFYETGLNVPIKELGSTIGSVLDPWKDPMADVGRANVHAIAGNHDYYTHHAFKASAFFGLVNIEMGPIGISDKGNRRAAEIDQWTYYYHFPASARYPVSESGSDSVEFIFFDSARMLRTDPGAWTPALDSLRELLHESSRRPNIRWRVLATHHPFYSVGEHGGYTVWNDEIGNAEYLTSCDKDSNALGWFKNFLDPEDLCADRYRNYSDSVKAAIQAGGVKIHLSMAGHEHSLQLLYYPDKDPDCLHCPDTYVVSGAGSKIAMVRNPSPPFQFTSVDPKEDGGISRYGFAQIRFSSENIQVAFFSGDKEELIDMGGGQTMFFIDRDGQLIQE